MCLSSLMPGVEAGLIRELIVTDGGSSDATVDAAKAWGAEIVQGAASRGAQLSRGCRAAQGDWFLVLHADTRLSDDWVGVVARHMGSSDAAWFNLAFEDGGWAGRIVAAWANLRSRWGLPYGDQGLLVPAALYDRVGGYPSQPLMEDVAIARALKGRLVGLEVTATTSASRYKKQGWLRRGGRNIWTLIRYFAGTPPTRLAQSYRS